MEHISHASDKPLYRQICELMRAKIEVGEIGVGSRVWSESEIVQRFHVSRNTARKAIEALQNEGIVSRIQGKGSFVRQPTVNYGLQNLKGFSEEISEKKFIPTAKVLSFKREHPQPFHAENLEISEEDWVYQLERIRYADREPIAYQVTYIPEKLCPGLLDYDFSTRSLYAVFEKEYGHVLSWQKTLVKPLVATQFLASILNVRVHTPLLYTESVTYLTDGTPIESNKNAYLSERYQFTVLSHRFKPNGSREGQ